jgi:hypothetical protein
LLTVSDPNADLSHIALLADGTTGIPQDTFHQNGWDYTGPDQIQIWGPTCDEITAGRVHTICIEIRFISDRNAKRDFAPVDGDAILDRLSRLPLSTWAYKTDARGVRHIGPMAQDFKLSFDVGANDTTIFPLDESGVAFAAIQALNAKIDRLSGENARLRKQLQSLAASNVGQPPGSGEHVPSRFGRLHDAHGSPHAESQQTPRQQ